MTKEQKARLKVRQTRDDLIASLSDLLRMGGAAEQLGLRETLKTMDELEKIAEGLGPLPRGMREEFAESRAEIASRLITVQ